MSSSSVWSVRTEVTVPQIETMGHRLHGHRVKLSGCTFRAADNTWLHTLVSSPDLKRMHDGGFPRDPEGWIGFVFNDARGRPLCEAFAPMSAMGEFVASITDGTTIDLVGRVIRLEQLGRSDYYGLVCEKIVARGHVRELQWPVHHDPEERPPWNFENGILKGRHVFTECDFNTDTGILTVPTRDRPLQSA